MALLPAQAKETTVVNGVNPCVLVGVPVSTFFTFENVFGINTIKIGYSISDNGSAATETGIGTLVGGRVLRRERVISNNLGTTNFIAFANAVCTVAWSSQSDPTGRGVINPSGDRTGAIDTAALQAAFVQGGEWTLGPGVFNVLANALVASAPIRLCGAGSADGSYTNGGNLPPGTTIQCNTTTGVAMELQGTGSVIQDIHFFQNGAAAQAGCTAIKMNQAWGGGIIRCSTYGWYDAIYSLQCESLLIEGNKVTGPQHAGYVNNVTVSTDISDHNVIGNTFYSSPYNNANPTAAIIDNYGGGLRIECNKVNAGLGVSTAQKFKYGVLLQPIGIASSSYMSVFPIIGNSIESCSTAAIYLDGSQALHGVDFCENITITGNEGLAAVGDNIPFVLIKGASGKTIFNNVIIDANAINGFQNYVDVADYAQDIYVGSVVAANCAGPILRIGTTQGVNQTVATINNVGYDISKWQSPSFGQAGSTILVRDYRGLAPCRRSAMAHRITKGITPTLAASPSTTGQFQVFMNDFSGCRLKVIFSGIIQGVGAAVLISERVFNCQSGGSFLSATVGTDTTFGPGAANANLSFDTSVAHVVTVNFNTLAGAGTQGIGSFTVEVDGQPQDIILLN